MISWCVCYALTDFVRSRDVVDELERRGRLAKVHDGINLVNDAANAAQSVHGAYESWKQSHRREPEPFYKWALHPIAARFLLEELD